MRDLLLIVLVAALSFAGGCTTTEKVVETEKVDESAVWRKVEIDLSKIDADGLRGAAGGKVAVSYEFCIPKTEECRARVAAIDSTVSFSSSPGRIGAGKDEFLCIGMTHQRNYRDVLFSLAELPYVKRIIVCHFE